MIPMRGFIQYRRGVTIERSAGYVGDRYVSGM